MRINEAKWGEKRRWKVYLDRREGSFQAPHSHASVDEETESGGIEQRENEGGRMRENEEYTKVLTTTVVVLAIITI